MELSTFIGAGTIKLFHDGEEIDDAYEYLKRKADPVHNPKREWSGKEDKITFPGPLSHEEDFQFQSEGATSSLNYRRILNALLETEGDYSVHIHSAEGEVNGGKKSVERLLSYWNEYSQKDQSEKIEAEATLPYGDDEVKMTVLIDRPDDIDEMSESQFEAYVVEQMENGSYELK